MPPLWWGGRVGGHAANQTDHVLNHVFDCEQIGRQHNAMERELCLIILARRPDWLASHIPFATFAESSLHC